MAKKKNKKPKKPYAAFPLYAHAGGVWAKKIRGKVRYFGPWNDWQGALELYKSQCDYLHLGKTPPPKEHTVANLLDLFLSQKQTQLNTGDIAESTFCEYEAVCVLIDSHFGKHRPADTLNIDDFNGLRLSLSKGTRKATLSPVTLKRRLTIARMVFAGQPKSLLKGLKSPSQKVLRAARREKGERFYEAADIRKLVKAADPHMKAMILLGINCGFGPKDCFTLPTNAVDLKNKWHNYARPKTEVERRCSLWPETTDAIKAVISQPQVFNGRVWDRFIVGREFEKICKAAKVTSHGFYSLRRTFETIATTADVSQAIIDGIMGHAGNDMASVYRQKLFDDQLKKCTDHIREWYLGNLVIR